MKKLLFAICLLPFSIESSAISFQDQLEARNSQWKSNRTLIFAGNAKSFPNDQAFIQAHFAAVEIVLRNADISALTPVQLENRYRNIEVLHAYATRGVFPENLYCNYPTPVFIDEFNTHCAVGHLMQMSGNDALAMRISSRNNYVYALKINDPEIYVWQESSGLTFEELALIQPTYQQPEPEPVQVEPVCTTAYFTPHPEALTAEQRTRLISYKGECKNNVLDGKWEQFYAPGQIWISGNFTNGKKNGEWQYYTASIFNPSFIERREPWVNGQLHGTYLAYDSAGRKSTEGMYVNGERQGRWTYWSRGYVVQTENYVNGKIEGDQYMYNPGADTAKKEAIRHITYREGRTLTYRVYSSTGVLQNENHYYFEGSGPLNSMVTINNQGMNQRKDSTVYNCVPPDPTLRKCYTETWSYMNDTLVGHHAISPKGIVVYMFHYNKGKFVSGTRLHTNGQAREKWKTLSDTSVIVYEQFDSTGKLLMKGPMLDSNVRYGAWEFYDTKGNIVAKGIYVDGLKEGVWMELNSLGILIEVTYEHGKRKREG